MSAIYGCMRESMRQTALHESGHALIYLLSGVPITAWSIRGKDNLGGFVEADYAELPDHLELTKNLAGHAATGPQKPWNGAYETLPIDFEGGETDIQQTARVVRKYLARAGLRGIVDNLNLVDDLMVSIWHKVRSLVLKKPFPHALEILSQYMLQYKEDHGLSINLSMESHLRTLGMGRRNQEKMQNLLRETQFKKILSSRHILARKAVLPDYEWI